MTIRKFAVTGAVLGTALTPAWADGTHDATPSPTTSIDIAGHRVPVLKGGLYDRFRSNPPLAVIEAEAPDVDLSWFRKLKKEKVDIGFESYSPNFYYKNSRVTAIFTADIDRLRELMPAAVLEKVQPLQVWPGRGLVALTAYAYHYCDNDSYNEIGLSVITTRPDGVSFGPLTLMSQAMSNDFWGYVLKLPVNTELARVRGVVGYNLPKWLTGIQYRETDSSVVVKVMDSETGNVDVILEASKLDSVSHKVMLVTNSFTNIDRQGRLTTGHTTSRQLAHASSSSAEAVHLGLTDGSLSLFIKSLKLGKMLKYEYVPEFQGALYAPSLL